MKRKHGKRNKYDAGKIGTLFLVAMVALAGAGVAYSMWFEDLRIIGTINTGEVEIGLYDYMTLDPGPSVSQGGALYPTGGDPENEGTADPNQPPGDNTDGKNIASHNSYNDGTSLFTKTIAGTEYLFTDHVTEAVYGVYPYYKSGTIVYVGNGGTIPVKITDVSYHYVDGNEDLLDYMVIQGWELREYSIADGWSDVNDGISLDTLVNTLVCFQLDPCHTLSIEIDFYFEEYVDYDQDGEEDPEELMPEGEPLEFEIKISAAQWNEVQCSDEPPVVCIPDLEITKEREFVAGQPYVDSNVIYTITVSNNGDCDATNVEVNDLLPDALTYVSHTVTPGDNNDYNKDTGLWTIGTLTSGGTATLTITATITETGGTATTPTQLALLVDGSGSIGSGDWNLFRNGLANAITDTSVFPHDSSVELTLIQFGGVSAQVEVNPTVVTDSSVASSIASQITSMSKIGSLTPLARGLTLTADTLKASDNYESYPRKVINIVTDGAPTYPTDNPKLAAINARDYLLNTLEMETEADGEIDAEAIGTEADRVWLRDNIVWPNSYDWPPAGPGWVRYVEDFTGFEEAIKEKFATILTGIENCATLTADNFEPFEVCISFNPQPAQPEP